MGRRAGSSERYGKRVIRGLLLSAAVQDYWGFLDDTCRVDCLFGP